MGHPGARPWQNERVERRLSPTEAVLWWLDRASPLNFTTVARVDGPLTAEALERGLDALRARHPALRVRIVADDAGHPRFHACERALPMRTCADPLLTALEAELAEPFPWSDGPFARCVWLPASGHVLLTLQHCVSDGHSGVFAMRDLLASAAAHLRGEPTARAPFEALVTADHRLPRLVRRPRFLVTLAAYAIRLGWEAIRLGRPLLANDGEVGPTGRVVRVLPGRFEPDLVAALLARARAEQTTVHGVLGAVQMQALVADGGGRCAQYATPIDLRPHLDPALADQVGYYVGASNARFRVEPDADPWSLARALRSTVKADVRSGMSMVLNRFGPRLHRHFTRGDATPEDVARRLYALRGTGGMTNLGRVTLDADLDPLRPTELWFAVATSALGDQVSTATSFQGRLFWNHCVATPTVSLDRARAAWADTRARLERAAQ